MGADLAYNRSMKTIKASFTLISTIFLACAVGNAQTVIKKVPPKPTVSVDGKVLFHDYCAVCHGANGKGAGPAASALKVAPGDLTQMARRNNGRFDDQRVFRILSGEEEVPAHGSKDMPTWGAIFNNMTSNPSLAQARVHALVQYLDDLQTK